MKNSITTHVLDTSLGSPAGGVDVTLALEMPGNRWQDVSRGVTSADGRASFAPASPLQAGTYRLLFEIGKYFALRRQICFYPRVEVIFQVTDGNQQYHIPLLLSPFGYSTYRGS